MAKWPYSTARWQRLRQAKLAQDPLCDYCPAGTVTLGHNILSQTFSQYEDDLPNPEWSLLQAMEDAAPPACTINRRTILGCFLFSDDTVHKRIKVLSGGERARLKLARMLLRPSNLLILDEPTNHLDRKTVGRLMETLRGIPENPAILLVSHDPHVISYADKVYEMEEGVLRALPMQSLPASHSPSQSS